LSKIILLEEKMGVPCFIRGNNKNGILYMMKLMGYCMNCFSNYNPGRIENPIQSMVCDKSS